MARPPVLPGPRPSWLKIKVPAAEITAEVERLMRSKKLVTVCEEARCPNQHECWGVHRTATFMLLGEICTRHCGFCNIGKGRPGEIDRSVFGNPGKYTFCFAEDESDPEWTPLNVARGFAGGTSTVTLFHGDGVQGISAGKSRTRPTKRSTLW